MLVTTGLAGHQEGATEATAPMSRLGPQGCPRPSSAVPKLGRGARQGGTGARGALTGPPGRSHVRVLLELAEDLRAVWRDGPGQPLRVGGFG